MNNTYTVYELHKDRKTYERYSSNDKFECLVYVDQHKYDYSITRSGSRLIVIDENENVIYTDGRE